MSRVESAARTIVRLTETQRADYMQRAARLVGAHHGHLPAHIALQVEELVYQAGNADARIARFNRIAADERSKSA
jgi:hypothetical protein